MLRYISVGDKDTGAPTLVVRYHYNIVTMGRGVDSSVKVMEQ
jgi:hypothetical protein